MAKTIYITEQQERFLLENKGKLFEYYIQASNPKMDNHILGNIQVWVYGDDRQNFTPHCHVMLADKSIEFEVSLIDWRIINVKRPKDVPCDWSSFRKMVKPFFTWLEARNKVINAKNKTHLYVLWDGTNQNNRLENFINKHEIKPTDKDLINYIKIISNEK